MKCGLLGRKLGHSYSPQIHSHLGDYTYSLFEKEPDEVENFLKYGEFDGINVTIPYKKTVMAFCDELSDTAKKMGAVNTIVRNKDGRLIGHNTDLFGFSSMLNRTGLSVEGKKVLVLGSGGASATACEVLKAAGANVVIISRSGSDNYNNLHLHQDASMIVNCTPVGMYPNSPASPLSLDSFPHLEGVLDLIYNPSRTQLIMEAEARNLVTENGLWMLVAQAKESAEWFIGHPLSDNLIGQIHTQLKAQMENILLIGMPGCGKSTIGRRLAASTGKTFVDADEQIVLLAGKSIPEIFSQDGEEVFRSIETQVLADHGKRSGCVIATGGGCVTRARNYPLLHQNSTIVQICRPLELLSIDGRPLSQTGSLQEMYRIRKPMYEQFADMTVQNTGTPDAAVKTILQKLKTGESL